MGHFFPLGKDFPFLLNCKGRRYELGAATGHTCHCDQLLDSESLKEVHGFRDFITGAWPHVSGRISLAVGGCGWDIGRQEAEIEKVPADQEDPSHAFSYRPPA